ncbi:Flagellum site-determining protein YlxH [subsurface metagenome]
MENKILVPYKRHKKRATIITVSGGKGGVGKTFFAVNFAAELKTRGYKVLIFDADINLSNVYLLLNVDDNNSFQDFLEDRIPITGIIQKGVGGVDALFAGGELENIFDLQGENFNKILGGLTEIETSYDYIIIDTQAGLNEFNLKLMLYSDRNVLIANPEITALVDLYKVVKITSLKKHGLRFEIVVNKSNGAESAFRIFNKISHTVSQFQIKTSLSFLGFILDDSRRVIESIQKRIPIVILHQSGNIRVCFKLIADSFLRNVKPKRKFPFFYELLRR